MTAILSAKLVTIFGGSGFIGRHIVRALAKEGWRVRVAVRRPNCAHFLRPMGRVGQIQLMKANVRSNDDVTAALTNADAAINLVGILAQRRRQRFKSLHVEAAGRIARIAREENVGRLIHFSALGANASSPARYFQTKAEGEARVRAEFTNATIVRPALTFGPEDYFFNRFAALAQIAPVLPLYGGGQTRYQPVFVGDLAQAVVQILRDPAMTGRITALAGPEVFTFEEVMRIVLRETCRKRLFMRLPMWLGRLQGAILQCLPKPLLTYDQVRMLETDTVADGTVPGLPELGITPMAVDAIISSYLWRFRPRGQFKTAA